MGRGGQKEVWGGKAVLGECGGLGWAVGKAAGRGAGQEGGAGG